MLTVNVITSGEDNKVLAGTIDGERYNVPFTQELFDQLNDFNVKFEDISEHVAYEAWVKEVKKALVEKEVDIIESACPDLMKDPRTGFYFVKIDGIVSKTAVPEELVEVILESVEKDIDASPIVKAWIRFLRNPNFTEDKADLFSQYITAEIVDTDEVDRLMDEEGFTEDMAVVRATYNDVAISKEGLIVCKKYAELQTEGWKIDTETNKPVRDLLYPKTADTVDVITGEVTEGEIQFPEFAEDLMFLPPVMGTGGSAFMCTAHGEDEGKEGHVIKVGSTHTLEDWNKVDCNDNRSCVKGLHVGGWKYVDMYKGLNCQLLECLVDPAEIGAIVDINHGDGAIRCREYFIYGAVEGRTKGIYHTSGYAKMKDGEWEDFKKAAVEAANAIVEAAGEVGL